MLATSLELDHDTAARAFGAAFFNLIRRGADGSLTLSMDRWRLEEATRDVFRFASQAGEAPELIVRVSEIDRVIWDRLPRQQVRSQIRFQLTSGDLLTFSGSVDDSALRS